MNSKKDRPEVRCQEKLPTLNEILTKRNNRVFKRDTKIIVDSTLVFKMW